MKTQIFKSIFLCLLTAVLFLKKADAQIIYTDVNPDVTSSLFNLDLDNDGTTDFTIQHTTGSVTLTCGSPTPRTNQYIKITPVGSNEVVSSTYVSRLTANTTINGSNTWSNTANQTVENQTWSCIVFPGCTSPCYPINSLHGSWSNAVDGYMGLKIIKNGKKYYGWLRMSLTGATSFTIKDYAYNSQNNQTILSSEGANYALVQSLSGANICAGNGLAIPFTIQGNFNSGNFFTVQLSSSTGNFSSPVTIGTLTSTSGGTINAIIPSSAIYGTAYRIRITSSNPVQDTPPDNGTNLSIYTAQSATITTSANPVCGSTSLYAPSATGNTFQWKLNGANIQNATNSTYTATATGNYSCLVTNLCGSVVSNTINQVINALPPGTITPAGTAEVCPGLTVTLNSDTTPGLTYQWYTYSGVAIIGATSSSYVADTTYPYWVVETTSFGCTKTAPYTYVYIRKPIASISNSRPLTFCSGDSTVLSTTSNNAYKYQWKKNGVNISGAVTYKYTAFTSGNYKVKVTNPAGGCDSLTMAKKVTVNCRIENSNVPEETESLFVYPNPAKNSIIIKFPLDSYRDDEAGGIQIVNLFGQVVYSEKTNKEQTSVDITRFSVGMYVIVWSSRENHETKTFSVIK